MSKFLSSAKKLYQQLEEKLKRADIRSKGNDPKLFSRVALGLIINDMGRLKEMFFATSDAANFSSAEEEIEFFKYIKPKFLAPYFYHIKVLDIMLKLPLGSINSRVEYLQKALDKIHEHFNNNRELYIYYRNGSVDMDNILFRLPGKSTGAFSNSIAPVLDPDYSTGWDIRLAKIRANEQLLPFLEKEMARLNGQSQKYDPEQGIEGVLNWTCSKTDLVELIYALHYFGAFNNGKPIVKEIALCLQKTFRIELGDFYRIFTELKMRKSNYTIFLDELKECFIKKMTELNEQD